MGPSGNDAMGGGRRREGGIAACGEQAVRTGLRRGLFGRRRHALAVERSKEREAVCLVKVLEN
jgi:hypothetical protein